MRQRVRQRALTVTLAAAAIALTVPLWAALSPDGSVRHTNVVDARLRLERPQLSSPVAEAGSLVMTGGLLIGLASLVRRTG